MYTYREAAMVYASHLPLEGEQELQQLRNNVILSSTAMSPLPSLLSQAQVAMPPTYSNNNCPSSGIIVPETTLQHQTAASSSMMQRRRCPPLVQQQRRSSSSKIIRPAKNKLKKTKTAARLASSSSTAVKPGRLFMRMLLNNDDNNNNDSSTKELAFEIGDFHIALRYTTVDPSTVQKAWAQVDKLRTVENLQATRRARTPWKRDYTTPTTKLRGKVYTIGQDVLDIVEDQREEVNDVTRPIAAALRDCGINNNERTLRKPTLPSLHITHTSYHTGDDGENDEYYKHLLANSFDGGAAAIINSSESTISTTGANTTKAIYTTTKEIWSSAPGINFVGASSLSHVKISSSSDRDHLSINDTQQQQQSSSSSSMKERRNQMYTVQTIDDFVMHGSNDNNDEGGGSNGKKVTICGQLGYDISPSGDLLPISNAPRYTLTFSLLPAAAAAAAATTTTPTNGGSGRGGNDRCNHGRGLTFDLWIEGGDNDDHNNEKTMKDGTTSFEDDDESNSRSTTTQSLLSSPVLISDYSSYAVNSAHIFFQQNAGESYFGLGGRTSQSNICGLEVQICHPAMYNSGSSTRMISSSSSSSSSSSLTMPHFISTSGISLHLDNVEPTIFDFVNATNNSSSSLSANDDDNNKSSSSQYYWYSIRSMSSSIHGTFLVGTSILHATELHTSITGRTKPLPKWTQCNGILAGMTGGTRLVKQICSVALFEHNVHVGGVLIKDWTGSKDVVGTSTTTSHNNTDGRECNNSTWYNWVLERSHYPEWQAFVDTLERRGISVGLYLCPYLEEVPLPLRSGRRYLYGEIHEDEYFVKREVPIISKRKMMMMMKMKNISDKKKNARKTKLPFITKAGFVMSNNSNNRIEQSCEGGEDGASTTATTAAAAAAATAVTMYNMFQRSKCGILDPSNPTAASWYKHVVKEEVIEYAGASFWLADMSSMGGPPVDGVYSSPASMMMKNASSSSSSTDNTTATAKHHPDNHVLITGMTSTQRAGLGGGIGGAATEGSTMSVATSATAGGGRPRLLLHNSYAEQWAKVNHDTIIDAGREGDGFFIVNCAYGSTSKYARTTSLADNVVKFNNGKSNNNNSSSTILQSVLNGLLNGGISGLTQGHCAVNLAVPRVKNSSSSSSSSVIDSISREMICRWFEMTAFTTLFRTHDGDCGMSNTSSTSSNKWISAYNDELVMKSLARWSKVFVSLSDYRLRLMKESSERGYPVVRHPLLHFPNDVNFIGGRKNSNYHSSSHKSSDASSSSSAFMLGDLIYIVPILKCGVIRKKVYLPQGAWIHLWSGEQMTDEFNNGMTVEVLSPVDEPPVFIRDCKIMQHFCAEMQSKGIIINDSKTRRKGSGRLLRGLFTT
jgi:alpha-glucosidase (family GH31 glycosyl hydrolase)